MLTGNGRHRRPRQAPAILVAAGVTGSAIAIPLLGATGASAADGTVWDKVADCESGGSWSADTGNGRYGGLQLTQEDWDKYGGLDYAASPNLASRSQQIAVAQKILADQGVGAWRTCGLLSGLTQESGAVEVDTGVADDSSSGASGSSGLLNSLNSSGSSDSSGGSSRGSSGNSSSGSSGDSADPSARPSAKSTASPSPTATADNPAKSDSSPDVRDAQSPDSSPTEKPKGDDPDKSGQEAGSWSLVDTGAVGGGRHRGASADETEVSGSAGSGRHAAPDAYTVRPGDTLASIADSLGLAGGWSELYAENEKAIGADPNHIVPGQSLDVGV